MSKRVIESAELVLEYIKTPLKRDYLIRQMLEDKELANYIRKLQQTNTGVIDAEQILHDTILSFIRSVSKTGFKFEKKPIAYLKTIARNLVYMQLRKKRRPTESIDEHKDISQVEDLYLVNSERRQIVSKILNQIDEKCMSILNLWAHQYKMSEIAQILEYDSVKYLKKKKGLCLKKVIDLVNKSPKLKAELIEYL